MMEDDDIQRMLVLRKLTRSIADTLRGHLKEYLATIAPLLRPKAVFGDYVQGGIKEPSKGSEGAFKDLQGLYEIVAGGKAFKFPTELKPPFEIDSSALEITPAVYHYEANANQHTKPVSITSPFSWVLSYSGFAPGTLSEIPSDAVDASGDVQRFILHHLVLHVVMSRQPGIANVLNALRFPVASKPALELGGVPLTYISSCITTVRPPDHVIIESTEISGTNAFEEIVNLDDLSKIRDPLKEQLADLVKSQDAERWLTSAR